MDVEALLVDARRYLDGDQEDDPDQLIQDLVTCIEAREKWFARIRRADEKTKERYFERITELKETLEELRDNMVGLKNALAALGVEFDKLLPS